MKIDEFKKIDLKKGGNLAESHGFSCLSGQDATYILIDADEEKTLLDVCCKIEGVWFKAKKEFAGGGKEASFRPAVVLLNGGKLHKAFEAAKAREFGGNEDVKVLSLLESNQVAVFVADKEGIRLEEQYFTKLSYNILRGKGTIGNLIEVSYGSVRILLDCGQELKGKEQEGEQDEKLSELEERVLATPYDAVLISHYHLDHAAHVGCIKAPVYMGKGCLSVINSENKYVHKPMLSGIMTFESQQEFEIRKGDCAVTIKPFLVDHSAYDSYMFLLSAGGRSILYTGDFRASGRKSFPALLERLPDKVDYLICEATNLKSQRPSFSERALEKAAAEVMAGYDRVFVFQAGTNIDRIVSFYKASRKTGKVFLMDRYMEGITENMPSIPNVKNFKDVFSFWAVPKLESIDDCKKHQIAWRLNKFHALGSCEIGCPKHPVFGDLSHFTMLVRPSMTKLLELADKDKQSRFNFSIFENSLLIYSLWKGYKEEEDVKAFLKFFEERGVRMIDLHTSGHADAFTIDRLVKKVNPTMIDYVHYMD